MHRLRAVRRGVSRRLHLRAGRRQPRRPTRSRPASGTGSCTRSTTCGASTATCASRRAPPRPSPSPSSSSSPSPTGPTPSTPRTSCSSTTTAGPSDLPWEDWREGDDLHTSGWMRATSPSGVAAYEGRVQWSGELGYGVRAPEGGQSDERDDALHRQPAAAGDVLVASRRHRPAPRPAGDAGHRQPPAGADGAAHAAPGAGPDGPAGRGPTGSRRRAGADGVGREPHHEERDADAGARARHHHDRRRAHLRHRRRPSCSPAPSASWWPATRCTRR